MSNILLLSIRPEYVNKIFHEKTKKVELRRVRPRLDKDDLVLVYASSPIKAVVGSFQVKKIIEEPLHKLWEKVSKQAGITPEVFDAYYQGIDRGVAIFLKETKLFPDPVELERLREEWDNFTPPQSYRYLNTSQFESIEAMGQIN